MKKITGLTFATILCTLTASFGQDEEVSKSFISKGQWLVGGSFSLSYAGSKNNSASVNPIGGYFIGEKTAVGLSVGYYSAGNSANGFYAQPFFRYYITKKRLAPFGEIAYGAVWSGVETISPSYRIGVGLDYFVSQNVAVEGNLRYFSNNNLGSDNTISDVINLSIGLQFFIPAKK